MSCGSWREHDDANADEADCRADEVVAVRFESVSDARSDLRDATILTNPLPDEPRSTDLGDGCDDEQCKGARHRRWDCLAFDARRYADRSLPVLRSRVLRQRDH